MRQEKAMREEKGKRKFRSHKARIDQGRGDITIFYGR
jgi:hypothetical protein